VNGEVDGACATSGFAAGRERRQQRVGVVAAWGWRGFLEFFFPGWGSFFRSFFFVFFGGETTDEEGVVKH
jgi:hypothetical protein